MEEQNYGLVPVTIAGAFPLTPNRDYVSFTPEAVKQALAEMDGLPIVDLTSEAENVIGRVDGNAYEIEESETEIKYNLGAILYRPKKGYSKITNVQFLTACSDEPISTVEIINVGVE